MDTSIYSSAAGIDDSNLRQQCGNNQSAPASVMCQ